jgi:hypothetical protein
MNRLVTLVAACSLSLSVLTPVYGADKKSKPGPLTGTWDCTAHGTEQGDMPFTLTLEQSKEEVTGSVSSPIGGTEISSGTFKKNAVEIHINTPNGNYTLAGKLKKNQLSGEWSTDTNQKGAFEGKKAAPATSGSGKDAKGK